MDQIRELWNQRAATLGEKAGTQDLIAAELERRAISRYVKDGMRVLDVGCGTGETVLGLARQYRLDAWGIDSAPEMIRVARDNALVDGVGESVVGFQVAEVLTMNIPAYTGGRADFDLIVSQRLLINLSSWAEQRAAIERIISWLKPGGLYLAVECSQDGLDGINELRAMVDLPEIKPPWHNIYLRDIEMDRLSGDLANARVARIIDDPEAICSTYALLSRVVNAKLAQDAGVQPAYDSPINQMALSLPPNIGNYGQNRLWVFRRCP